MSILGVEFSKYVEIHRRVCKLRIFEFLIQCLAYAKKREMCKRVFFFLSSKNFAGGEE